MYPFSNAAVLYTIKHLFEFAGIAMEKDFEMVINRNAFSVRMTVWGNKQVILKVMQQNEIDQLIEGELPLQKFPSFDSKVDIPLFITDNKNDFAAISDNELIFHADILTISFIMLSRYEETLIEERDQQNRFEYKSSLACKYDFIDIPIVDEYAMLLRLWILKYIPTLNVQKRKGEITQEFHFGIISIRRGQKGKRVNVDPDVKYHEHAADSMKPGNNKRPAPCFSVK